jgi:hypothetical protein
MSRFLSVSTLIVLLIVCAAPSAGAGSGEPAGGTSADAPAFCTSYSTGADTHTTCAPSVSAPPGSTSQGPTIACRNYTVGSDTHAECGPVPAARLNVPRQKNAAQVPPPASALRCYTYHIGSSSYTDCR